MILNEYETVLIVQPEAPDAELQRVSERLDTAIQSFDGAILYRDDWGVRKLAYPIRKNPRGRYIYLNFVSSAPCVAEVERIMRIEADVVRFMTVQLGTNVDLEALQQEERQQARRPSDDGEREEGERDRDGDRGGSDDDSPRRRRHDDDNDRNTDRDSDNDDTGEEQS